MTDYKIITYPGDFRAFKCLIAARFNGITVATDDTFKTGVTDKTPEFLALSPLGKVPVLTTPEGTLLESNAIARFLARHRNDTQLMGSTFFQSAQVDSWVDWCQNELEIPVSMWIYPIFKFMPPNHAQVKRAKADTRKALAVLESHLESRSFMVGSKVTLADIVLVSVLVYPMKMVFDANFRSSFPSVTRWFMTCVAMAEFTDVVNEVNLCKEAMALPKGEKKAKKGGKKEKKAKKVVAKKPKKKKAARIRHPLDMLEKSTFILDTWKKTYSNSKPNYYKSMDWLWANFEQEGYSLWTCKYKFNKEMQVDWLCSNKIAGYTQRLDDVRKWTFGVMGVLDTKEALGHYTVEGAWITRGQTMKFLLDAHEEGDTFEWTRIEGAPTDVQKKYIADLWCGEKFEATGVDIYDSCVFK